MAKNYTTNTASLKATRANVSKLDAKKMLLNGKNILDYISESEFDSYDTRDPQLKNDELDVWNTEISLSDNGHIEVKPHVHSVKIEFGAGWVLVPVYEGITESQVNTLNTAVKVIDNEVLGANDEHIMYWQTDGLTDGYCMFNSCTNLTSFSSDLSSLTLGDGMFQSCSKLISFTSDLSNLTSGYHMFFSCSQLTSFSSDSSGSPVNLSSLTGGNNMFANCTNLTSFSSDLSSLTNGSSMFNSCKIDAQSVANIVHTLPTHETNGNITIGIGCDDTEADQLLFAQECDCDTWQELLDDFSAKNWTVTFQCNGRPTTTYNMRRGETLPIYAKLEEVTDEKHAQYTSQDGSKFYNIDYFHSTNGSTEGYDVFSSLEEAISTYNVTPKN